MDKMRNEKTGIYTWAKKQEELGPPRSLTGLVTVIFHNGW
jgi:hypothetical protein